MTFSVVIATCGRDQWLKDVVEDWAKQSKKPQEITIVVAGSQTADGFKVELQKACDFPVRILESPVRSAAQQRNLGAASTSTDWLVFCDDDVRFGADLAYSTIDFLLKNPNAVAVSPRMQNYGHQLPSPLLKIYYQIMAGYSDSSYGARLFGPAISCYPCWEEQDAPVESNWLPSTLLWIRRNEFLTQQFPKFQGYSLGEDAHMTHRVWRDVQKSGGKLYFLGSPLFDHLCIQSGVKKHRFHLGRMAVRNHGIIAREAMGLPKHEVFLKLVVHRLFMTIYLFKTRRRGWIQEMLGWWCAW